jgi:hypothetical protein
MSPRRQRQRVRHRDGLFAQALHVEGDLLLPLRDQHLGVEGPGAHHGAQAAAQQGGVVRLRPGAQRLAFVVQHAYQGEGQVGRAFGGGIHRRAAHGTGGRKMQVGEVSGAPRAARGFGHVQMQRGRR